MPRLMTQFERARSLISQPPEKRMEHEILQLVPWLRSKAKLFKQLKSGLWFEPFVLGRDNLILLVRCTLF
ncbi:hypothetical protein ElyMa_000059500 [Elysia marginata]|uniref:Uncharacterized protein n=1 Tax=Elysia marginata TaxID=1093978 RepID=A0AAV4EFC1_9GAST|nr:hypothetical protein ElyMa_000059500 [Elysia marginata]